MVKCPRCHGAGLLPDSKKVGDELRKLRKKARVGLREMAVAIGCSAQFLHDLEHGRRGWTLELIGKFKAAIKTLRP